MTVKKIVKIKKEKFEKHPTYPIKHEGRPH